MRKLGIREILVVVGFKKEVVMEHYPDFLYVYNPRFHISNTAQSLRLALERLSPDDVVWTNGDVVFEEAVLEKVLGVEGNAVAVANRPCGREEVKYTLDGDGLIKEISKEVKQPLGEAVGINKIARGDFEGFLENLARCSDDDYFEKAVEHAVKLGMRFRPVDITEYKCIEVDFEDDLREVKSLGKLWHI